ncbi:hypothetical protein DFJ74DRAFT_105397 [Hyaloraphidium curvatum]|nr:hypothetical protein DFJ74DRAFT_105397 [Hyaloraphidium curvatum]
MATLHVLSANATRQLDQLENDLQRLEGPGAPPSLQGEISASLGNASRLSDEIEAMAKREISMPKREKTLSRAAEIRDRVSDCRRRLDAWKARQQKLLQEQQERLRSELLGPDNQSMGSDSTTIPMGDYFIREGESLKNAGMRIDEYISSGRNALQELFEQRSIMKNAQRRILDIANTLGLSTSVLRYIERRGQQDKWILYGGMLVTLVILGLIIWYLA